MIIYYLLDVKLTLHVFNDFKINYSLNLIKFLIMIIKIYLKIMVY